MSSTLPSPSIIHHPLPTVGITTIAIKSSPSPLPSSIIDKRHHHH
jgi:hypothetical protein